MLGPIGHLGAGARYLATARRQHAIERHRGGAARRGGRSQRGLIDRRVRLAAIEHFATERRIGIGERAGAIDQGVAALDDHVGIGADHEQRAPPHRREHVAVIVRRFDGVVEQTRAHHIVGGLKRREGHFEAGEDRMVALRTEMEDTLG